MVSTIDVKQDLWHRAPPTIFSRNREDVADSGSARSERVHVLVALHVELTIILVYNSEAEPLVQPDGGVDLDHVQTHGQIRPVGLANQTMYHFRANSSTLKWNIYKELRNEQGVVLDEGL